MSDKYHIVYVDTLKSFKRAKIDINKKNVIFFTDNPLLANTPETKNKIKDISLYLSQNEALEFNKMVFKLLEEIESDSFKFSFYKRYGLVNRRLNLILSIRGFIYTLFHKAFMLDKFIREKNIKKFYIYTVKTEKYDFSNPFEFPRFFSPIVCLAEAGFLKKIKFEINHVEHSLPESYNDTRSNSVIIKILTWPLINIFFNLSKNIIFPFGRKKIYYAKSCEALKETIPWLFFKGYSLKNIKIPGYAVIKSQKDEKDIRWLDKYLSKNLDKNIKKIFKSDLYSYVLKNIILDRLSYGFKTSSATVNNLEYFFKKKLSKAKIIITSGMYGLIASQIHQMCKNREIKLVYFEHGVTAGIASFANKYIDYSEATTCDHLLVCSNKSKDEFSKIRDIYTKPNIDVIGEAVQKKNLAFPKIQKYIMKKKLSLDKYNEIIYHVSSLLYPGNLRPSYDSPVESYVYNLELNLLQNVYRDIPQKVLYKKYPTRRMVYQPCYSEIIDLSSNIKMMNDEDFRYTRSVADLIVTDSTQSALAWCLSVNKPLIHLISSKCHSLIPSIVEKFNNSFILVNLDNKNWIENLKNKLLTPREELICEWKNKRINREHLLEEYIYGTKGLTGLKAANFIEKLYR